MYEYNCKIVRVVDGDTVDIECDLGWNITVGGSSGRIRLHGLDTPETRTRDRAEKAHGLLAKACVEKHLKVGETYKLRTIKKGKFGRYLGIITFNDKGDTINDLLIELLLGVPYHGENRATIRALHEKNRKELVKQGLLE